MTTFSELRLEINDIIQDSSLYPKVATLINQGVQEIAGGMLSSLGGILTPPLPKLYSIGTVTTSTNYAYVDMPSSFQRDLCLVVNSSGTEINIAETFTEFTSSYPALSNSGSITEAIEYGDVFYYQGIPTSTESVTLHFYRLPVDMEDDDDTPDGLPSHLHRPLLVNFVCWKLYEFIEDGVDGEMINTKKYYDRFANALLRLELSIINNIRSLEL